MIDLVYRCDVDGREEPFVAILLDEPDREHPAAACLVAAEGRRRIYQREDMVLSFECDPEIRLHGDVVFVEPVPARLARWLRADSLDNTLLITEQCDQLCVMCSQPPKKYHRDLFPYYLSACLLAPPAVQIGFSGGEPTLYKQQLFALLEELRAKRPDLKFHVLTNGQHFTKEDIPSLRGLTNVLWGVPIYSSVATLHDEIVGKSGAHDALLRCLSILGNSGAAIELRTVVMKQNQDALHALSQFVAMNLSFIHFWAIMQLERAGFARGRWKELFFDHSQDFSRIGQAAATTSLHGIRTAFYNFPLCTIPAEWRAHAEPSISDWKRKYVSICNSCTQISDCGGFFEWHPDSASYLELSAL